MGTKKVIIVDDHQIISEGIRSLLGHLEYDIDVTESNNGREALQIIADSNDFNLLLVDINMPSFSGMDLLDAIRSRKLATPAAVLSGSTDVEEIQQCIDSGAIGFIPKIGSPDLMLAGIRKLLEGQQYLPPHLENLVYFKSQSVTSAYQVEHNIRPNEQTIVLKNREMEILELIGNGKSNKDIATILNISPSTVKFHISSLFRKLNARSRTQCVSLAVKHKLLAM